MLYGLALGSVEDSEKVVLSHGDPGAAEDSQVYMNFRNFDTMPEVRLLIMEFVVPLDLHRWKWSYHRTFTKK
jgi:hypothetical protein